jgi:uncharacterized protein YutE (UPF0331/DUF86 family)
MKQPLEREAILPRIDGIRDNLEKLRVLGNLPFKKFCKDDSYALTQHYLRLSLEGVFHIGSHILSRMPGGRAVEYKDIAIKLGKKGIVTATFSEKKLVPMAGMRNLLVHHYADIDHARLYGVIRDHLKDIEKFLQSIKKLIEKPEKFHLTVS